MWEKAKEEEDRDTQEEEETPKGPPQEETQIITRWFRLESESVEECSICTYAGEWSFLT